MAENYLSPDEAADLLSISPAELITLRERGEIRGYANRGNWGYRIEDLEDLARRWQMDRQHSATARNTPTHDLWQQIRSQFTDVTQVLSRAISSSDVELQIREWIEGTGIPWPEIVQLYRNEQSFPKNIVRMALTSDCLRILALAILADGEVEDSELATAHTLSLPFAEFLASMERYRTYANLQERDCPTFLQEFIDDVNWFGGHDQCSTNLLGAYLSYYVSLLRGDATTFDSYETIIRSIIDEVVSKPV